MFEVKITLILCISIPILKRIPFFAIRETYIYRTEKIVTEEGFQDTTNRKLGKSLRHSAC